MTNPKKLVVIGGVAGGASAAARARRLNEDCEIIIFDRGAFVSFANCGLPYYVGDVITDEKKLIIASPELFQARFRIEVRLESEVLRIDREDRKVWVRERSGREYAESYDALVLSPGAQPIVPDIKGAQGNNIFVLRTIPDSRLIRDFIAQSGAMTAVVVGAGFVGLELAENLHARGLSVTLVERDSQVLPPLDPEMAQLLNDRLTERGIRILSGQSVSQFVHSEGGGLLVETDAGQKFQSDMAILCVGVRPETALAKQTGLTLGTTGGILVDEGMRSSDPRIWAVGDAVEIHNLATDAPGLMPLAGPANRQGRIAADVIFGRQRKFKGVQGTAVCGCFGLAAACTGASEKALRRAGIADFDSVHIHPGHHVGYYPGAKQVHLKLTFSKKDGRIWGAQAVAEEGAVRRIDVLATAIAHGLTVFDLEDLELCYAPQYGAAKDPVNLAGFVAANMLRGDMPTGSWSQLIEGSLEPEALLVDVRSAIEFDTDHVENALNFPLESLRERYRELPEGRPIYLYCAAGQRAYYATRFLQQRGYNVKNLPGGIQTFRMFAGARIEQVHAEEKHQGSELQSDS